MAIKIEEQKPEIPIDIGPLEFKFVITDEAVMEFRKKAPQIQEELEGITVDPEDEDALKVMKDVMRRGYDFILGQGAFEKIYALTPSIFTLAKYYQQMTVGLQKELESIGKFDIQKEKAQKYIRQKKQKQRRR